MWWFAICNVFSPEETIPVFQVLELDIELCELGEGREAHQQCVPEDQVCPFQLFPGGRYLSFFLPFFPLPTVQGDLTSGTDWTLVHFRESRHNVFDLKPSNFPMGTVLPLFLEEGVGALEFV